MRSSIELAVEALEPRCLLTTSGYSPIDGVGNNLAHPVLGSAGTDLKRMVPAAYADGISAPIEATRPSARLISNVLSSQTGEIKDNRNLSAFIYAWGQFIDHDMDLTTQGSSSLPIAVPNCDASFDPSGTGTQTLPFTRSVTDPSTGPSTGTVLQQLNQITSYLDGSMVYGSDPTRALALRTMSGGKLKTSTGDLLPLNTALLPNANDAHIVPDNQLFLAGDIRANENVDETVLQTLFVREHNRIADQIAAANPTLTDEQIYLQARQIVIGEIQAITYNEFLPALLGSGALAPYKGYNSNVDPSISTEFSTAAFRVGHSQVGPDIEFFDNNGNPIRAPLDLDQAFFDPRIIEQYGIDGVLKYLA
ncbi:MAG TPA: peroxidase family protein, partial [Pirellulales bacterium]|nr:peroxidase family protein [Pirellulales bacterium]